MRFPHLSPKFYACAIVLIGAALRFAFPGTIEYKADEQYMVEHALEMGRSEPWSWLGMRSGVALHNPGMSVWIFSLLGILGRVSSPIGLAQSVQFLNVGAIVLMVVAAFRWVPARDRNLWLWAAAFVAVNPMMVVFHRKIWAQCVLPIFSLLGLLGWLHRRRCLGSALWGGITGVLGQIHMSGFFWGASFLIWTILKKRHRHSVRWPWFTGAAILTLLPAIPWFHHLANSFGGGGDWSPSLRGFRSMRYWKHWAADSVGAKLEYILGGNLDEFLAGPVISGLETHLMWIATMVGFALGLAVLVNAIARFRWKRVSSDSSDSSVSGEAVAPLLWIFGILLTLAHIPIHRHYLIATFPVEWLWLIGISGALGRWRTVVLTTLFALQLTVSVGLLGYLHTHGGAPEGEFGISYEAQVGSPIP